MAKELTASEFIEKYFSNEIKQIPDFHKRIIDLFVNNKGRLVWNKSRRFRLSTLSELIEGEIMKKQHCKVLVTIQITEDQVNRIKNLEIGFQITLWNEFGSWDFFPNENGKIEVRHRNREVTELELNKIETAMHFEF